MNEVVPYLKKLSMGECLSMLQVETLFAMLPQASKAQQIAAMVLLSAKKLSLDELAGALRYLHSQAKPMATSLDVIDIVGTGGDGLKTFNISTAASLLVASCGIPVAKHGNRAGTSLSGSTDVIEALGIPLLQHPQDIYRSLARHHFVYLAGALLNPMFPLLGSIRKEVGIPTLLNIIGPIANPMRPKKQLVGVFRKDLMLPIARLLQARGSHQAMVVHSHDGLDEISIGAPTLVAQLQGNRLIEYEITPEMAGLARGNLHAIVGGSASNNAQIIMDVLSGKRMDECLDIVLINAAAALQVAGRACDLKAGVAIARSAIESGKALQCLLSMQGEKN